jgi:alcohol dehydrogenase class IV
VLFRSERDRLSEIARLAVVDPTAGTNPVPLTEDNVTALLNDCYDGILRPIA